MKKFFQALFSKKENTGDKESVSMKAAEKFGRVGVAAGLVLVFAGGHFYLQNAGVNVVEVSTASDLAYFVNAVTN